MHRNYSPLFFIQQLEENQNKENFCICPPSPFSGSLCGEGWRAQQNTFNNNYDDDDNSNTMTSDFACPCIPSALKYDQSA